MTKRKIQSMADLMRERKRIVHALHEKEKELAVSAEFFKHNHKKIIWHYVNPFSSDTTLGVIGKTLESTIVPIINEATGVNVKALKGEKILDETVKTALVSLAVSAVKKWMQNRKRKKQQSIEGKEEDTELNEG